MTVNIGRRRKFMTVPFPSVESKVAARSYKGSMNGKKKKKKKTSHWRSEFLEVGLTFRETFTANFEMQTKFDS